MKIPALVMCYLPMVDRIRRLLANPRDAAMMTWHARERNKSNLSHPVKGTYWQQFDRNHPEFSGEDRNIRFAVCTDGMNPYGQMRNPHSNWPMILAIYNLSPWSCHKRKYVLLTILIFGPREAGNGIDVFLEPLLEDMQKI